MPNHIHSKLILSYHGDKEDYLRMILKEIGYIYADKDGKKDYCIDFNSIIPMPPHSDTFFAEGGLGEKERQKYGANNWYDWSTENWGTKWNAYDCRLLEYSDYSVIIRFNTAWSSVPKIIRGIMEKYPDLGVTYIAVDEGQFFAHFIDRDSKKTYTVVDKMWESRSTEDIDPEPVIDALYNALDFFDLHEDPDLEQFSDFKQEVWEPAKF